MLLVMMGFKVGHQNLSRTNRTKELARLFLFYFAKCQQEVNDSDLMLDEGRHKATAPPNAAPRRAAPRRAARRRKKSVAAPPPNERWEKFIFHGAAFFNARRGSAFGGAAP